jgi:peptidoglycan-associated lipoprotein
MRFAPRSLSPLFSALAVLGALGCATESPVVQAPAQQLPSPPVVAQAQPARSDANAQEMSDVEAMRRLLNGPVAYFDFDKAELTPQDQEKLRTLASELKAHPRARIVIAGNTDEFGTEEYNLALGQRRAAVARSYLVALGVPDRQVGTVSYGEEKPADSGHDAAARAKNRRDEAQPAPAQ